jgi:hypothetical protein
MNSTLQIHRTTTTPAPADKSTPSPAYVLVHHVWTHAQQATGPSWVRLNAAMARAVLLAVEAGLCFNVDDFTTMLSTMRGHYWFPGESVYARAVECANLSACKAFEAHAERPPFIFSGSRLAVGSTLDWAGRRCEATSFAADGRSLIACVRRYEGGVWKVEKRYRIGLDELRAAEAARKAAQREAARSSAKQRAA